MGLSDVGVTLPCRICNTSFAPRVPKTNELLYCKTVNYCYGDRLNASCIVIVSLIVAALKKKFAAALYDLFQRGGWRGSGTAMMLVMAMVSNCSVAQSSCTVLCVITLYQPLYSTDALSQPTRIILCLEGDCTTIVYNCWTVPTAVTDIVQYSTVLTEWMGEWHLLEPWNGLFSRADDPIIRPEWHITMIGGLCDAVATITPVVQVQLAGSDSLVLRHVRVWSRSRKQCERPSCRIFAAAWLCYMYCSYCSVDMTTLLRMCNYSTISFFLPLLR